MGLVTLDEGGRYRSHLEVRLPAGDLREVADLVWIRDCAALLAAPGDGPRPRAADWRVVPDVHPHVMLVRFPDGRIRASLVGPRSGHIDVNQSDRSFTLGIRLKPGVLPGLTGFGANWVRDRSVELEQLFGAGGRRIAETLANTANPRRALIALEGWLGGMVRRSSPRRVLPSWQIRGFLAAVDRHPSARVGDIAAGLGVSPRGLRMRFARDVGLSPKLAQRVLRLHTGLSAALAEPGTAGSAVAHAAGFADQSHLVHECNALLGETLRAFTRRGAGSCKPGFS